MSLLSKPSSTNQGGNDRVMPRWGIVLIAGVFLWTTMPVWGQAAKQGRESIRISVVAVNPSRTKTQKVPVKTVLPTEVTPADMLNSSGLQMEFDTESSTYYLFGEDIELKPQEVRTFQVEVKDVWVVPLERVDALRSQTKGLVENLKGTEYYDMAKKMEDSINASLDVVLQTQNDETVSTKRHIGVYRSNLRIIDQIIQDIARLEKQVNLAGSPPVPDVLENSKMTTSAPSKNTTWMIIFIIMAFLGLLAGGFFFTWYTQAHFTKNALSAAKDAAFPKADGSTAPDAKAK